MNGSSQPSPVDAELIPTRACPNIASEIERAFCYLNQINHYRSTRSFSSPHAFSRCQSIATNGHKLSRNCTCWSALLVAIRAFSWRRPICRSRVNCGRRFACRGIRTRRQNQPQKFKTLRRSERVKIDTPCPRTTYNVGLQSHPGTFERFNQLSRTRFKIPDTRKPLHSVRDHCHTSPI